jgi:hypothetical protein
MHHHRAAQALESYVSQTAAQPGDGALMAATSTIA